MSAEYKAFISFCRQPEDSSVAAEICRLLENYPVAHEVKSQGKQMGKIYCDDAKPRTSSELSDDTRAALENSEYLIAVFSEKAKESGETSNEIEYFLKSHTADKILPVIIDGETEEVIPENIMEEKKVLCDWRVKREKAVGRELRKIANILLGCSPKKRKRKKIKVKKYLSLFVAGMIFLALLAAVVYLIVSPVQGKPNTAKVNLQSEYLASRSMEADSQSEKLASQSLKAYNERDRVKAAALALEAVGTQDANASYNSDIVLALTKAVMPYTGGNENYLPEMTYTSNRSKVDDFEFSCNSEYLYTIDRKCNLTIYETESGIELVSVPLNNVTETGGIYSFTVLPDNSVAIQYYSVLYCYGIDGRERWTMEDVYTCIYAENADRLIVMTDDDNKALNVVDYSTGKINKKITLPDTVCDYTVLADGNANGNNVLLVSKANSLMEDSDPYYACYLFDISSGRIKMIYRCNYHIYAPVVTDDGKLIFMKNNESIYGEDEISNACNIVGEDMIIASKMNFEIVCVDVDSESVLWENRFKACNRGDYSVMLTPNQKRVLCRQGNAFCVLDINTGKMFSECETESTIISMTTDDKKAYGFTQDGSYFVYRYKYQECNSVHISDENLWKKVRYNQAIYALDEDGKSVIKYGKSDVQPEWVLSEEDYDSLDFVELKNSMLRFGNDLQYVFFDTDIQKIVDPVFDADWDLDFNERPMCVGLTSDGTIWLLGEKDDGQYLVRYDFITENNTEYLVKRSQEDADGYKGLKSSECDIDNDRFIYLCHGSEKSDCGLDIVIFEPDTGNIVNCSAKCDEATVLSFMSDDKQMDYRLVDCFGNFAYIYIGNDHSDENILLEADLTTGELKAVAQNVTDKDFVFAADVDNGRFAVSDAGKVKLMAAGSEDGFDLVGENGVKLYRPSFIDDELFVFGDDGYLYRFSAEDGNLLGKTAFLDLSSDYHMHLAFSDEAFEVQKTSDGYIIVNIAGTANVIETETWTVTATVADFVAYDEENDSYICEDDGSFFSYKRLAPAQLIEKAKELAGDYKLTESDMAV